MDALIQLMQALKISSTGVKQIRCLVPPGGLIPLKFSRPKTHFESLFSLPYALAVTALDGMPGLRSFHQDRVLAGDVSEMLKRIEVVESPKCVADHPDFDSKSYGSRGEVRVEVDALDGRTEGTCVTFAPGHPNRPMTWDQAESKFMGCLDSAGLPTHHAKTTFQKIRDIEKLPNFKSLLAELTLNED
jgi:2-methylcitrate dehydratase PrpD